MTPPALAQLTVADHPQAWERIGFAVRGGACRLGSTTILLDPAAGEGLVSWTLTDIGPARSPPADVDGLPTRWVTAGAVAAGAPDEHPNGALGLDHVVVMTPALARTTAALGAIGLECRRVRDAEVGGRPLRQAFFRLGEVILEVVGPPEAEGNGPAAFWGLVAVVADLDACAQRLGPDLGTARDAVQPDRRIATVRPSSGVTVPLALITPRPAR